MGKLTTHVLDTASGKPAGQMNGQLFEVAGRDKKLLKSFTTNSDGRCDAPLLADAAFKSGTYELVFEVGEYFKRTNASLPEPAFLNQVPLQFSIADQNAHYHVPLLVSPWSYSTYRGS